MTSAAPEMPISDARDQLADVVNQAAYSGRITYVTRRGKRMAMILPVNHAAAEAADAREAAEAAKAHEAAIVEVCRDMWQAFAGDEEMQSRLREGIDRAVAAAEESSDAAAIDAALAEITAGAETVSAEDLHSELGL